VGYPTANLALMLGEHPKTGGRMLDAFGGESDNADS